MVCNNNALQSIGYGKIDPVNKTSTTHTAITDQAGLSHINTKNFKQKEVQNQLNPILINDFNKEQALKELNAQVTITQAFDTERRAIRSEFAKKAEDYRKKAKDLVDDNPRKAELETKAKQIDDNLRIFDGITSALYAPNSNGIIGDTVRAASPQLAYQIGQEFKRKDQEGSAQHLLAHAILGAAVSYATGNNITTGVLSGATSEAVAPALANYLYGTNEPSELNQEQKDTIVSILNLATVTTAYTATDGNTTDAMSAAEIGKVGVENNQIEEIRLEIMREHELRSNDPEWDKAFREAEWKQLVILNEAAKFVISPYGAGVDYYNTENLSEKALAIASAIPAERAATKGYGLAKKLFEEAAALYKSNKLTSAGKKVEQAVVELQRGRTNQWSQLANKPQANSIYRFDNGFQYTTDAQKRVKEVSADLRIDPWNRNAYQQRIAGGLCRQESDCGGHLIASIFGGPGEAINLVPMDAKLNGAGGEWYKLEQQWKKTLQAGGKVQVKIQPIYSGNSKRPESFVINQVINDVKLDSQTLKNTSTGN